MTASPTRQHYNLTLAILTMAGTAFALQQTMVFPALSTFQHEFDTSPAWATWVLTVFLLTASVATPLLGKLGDQHGKERMLVVALSIFLLGTIGGAFAWDIGSLIGFRALAGAGGAVFPLSFGIIRDEFPPDKVKVGIGLLSAVFGVGGGFGIVLSGLIVDHLSWRWLFVAGAIPVAASIVLVHRYVPESPVKSHSRLDVPGAVLLAAALVSLLVALTEGEHWGWSSAPFLLLIGTSAVLLAAWIVDRAARRRADGRHADDEPAARIADEHDRADRRVRDVRDVRARAAVRQHPRLGRVRLRRLGDSRRALPPTVVDHDALRRPSRRAARPAVRLQVAARPGHGSRRGCGRSGSPQCTTSPRTSSSPWSCSGRESPRRSLPWRL